MINSVACPLGGDRGRHGTWLAGGSPGWSPCMLSATVLRSSRRSLPDARSGAASTDRVDLGGWSRRRCRRSSDLRDRCAAMADRPHRGAGHVAGWLDGGTVIIIQAAILGFPYGDAVRARSPVAPPISQIMNGLINALIKLGLLIGPHEVARATRGGRAPPPSSGARERHREALDTAARPASPCARWPGLRRHRGRSS